MFKILELIRRLQSTNGRNDKEFILKENSNNEELKKLFKYIYDPFLIYGIQGKKLRKLQKLSTGKSEFNHLFDVFEYLLKHPTGNDETVKKVVQFINNTDDGLRDFYIQCITKSLKTGCSSTTINKCWGKNFVIKFEVMLAKKYEDYDSKIKGEFAITLKLDGIRCVAIKENGSVSFFSRQGQPIEDLVELTEDFSRLPDNMVYDGELLLINTDDLSSDDLFRATQKVVRKDGVKKNVDFIMFDLLPLNEFKQGKSKKIHADRLLDLIEGLDLSEAEFIKKVPVLYSGRDKSKIYELLDKVVADGKEGLMVSNALGFYTTKRSDSLLKVKKMHTVDLEIIGYEEGTGKNVGKLGAFIVDYKGYPCGVGSGYTDEQRVEFWHRRNELVSRVIETQYFEESHSEKGNISLRFPVFKCLREEGKEVSYF